MQRNFIKIASNFKIFRHHFSNFGFQIFPMRAGCSKKTGFFFVTDRIPRQELTGDADGNLLWVFTKFRPPYRACYVVNLCRTMTERFQPFLKAPPFRL